MVFLCCLQSLSDFFRFISLRFYQFQDFWLATGFTLDKGILRFLVCFDLFLSFPYKPTDAQLLPHLQGTVLVLLQVKIQTVPAERSPGTGSVPGFPPSTCTVSGTSVPEPVSLYFSLVQ